LEGEKTEPNRTEINRFESVSVRFGSKTKNKIKSIWLYILVQNRTGPKMLSPSYHTLMTRISSLMGYPGLAD
jgi:hypothetical protein